MNITTGYIDTLAPNPAAISNGKSLANKGSFKNLRKTPDGTLLLGECMGSGSKAYSCSIDFTDTAKPVPRCNCPSRQFPCKHVIGLMYAYTQGAVFLECEVPEDIAAKRKATEKRATTQKTEKAKREDIDAPPSKAKITAATKKIDTQLEGIEIAEKLLKNIVLTGLASIDARGLKALSDQITQLGNYRIRGIEKSFEELHMFMRQDDAHFTRSVSQLIFLRALLKKSKEHLTLKKTSPLTMAIDSEIEEQIDHVWKLEDLHAHGSFLDSVELFQLSFNVHDDPAKKEYTDIGYFLCKQNGVIYTTKNHRPYKSLKYIKQDDSIMAPLVAKTMYIYPGGLNPRVRFGEYTLREWQADDYMAIKAFASEDFAVTAKAVKNQIKTPLANMHPVAILYINELSFVQDTDGKINACAKDENGTVQLLQGDTLPMLMLFDKALLKGVSMLVRYENNIDSGLLTAQPLSVATNSGIIRLEY